MLLKSKQFLGLTRWGKHQFFYCKRMVNKISFAIWKRSGYLEQVRITNDFQKTAVMELFKFIRQMSSTAQAVVPEK